MKSSGPNVVEWLNTRMRSRDDCESRIKGRWFFTRVTTQFKEGLYVATGGAREIKISGLLLSGRTMMQGGTGMVVAG